MTRTITTTVLAAILLTSSLAAQELRPTPMDPDPIASATARIMNQFFPARRTARSLDELSIEERPEPLPWVAVPMVGVPGFWSMPQRLPRRPVETGSWLSSARSVSSMARNQPRENAPTAFASAFTNGSYAIEAIIPTDEGPEKVRLNGTRLEIEEQFDALPFEIRRSLAPNLGL